MAGKHSRDKGRRYENEIVGYLNANGYPATRVSAMYQPGPDIKAFNSRYIEARRRASNYQSLNTIARELDGDASLYFTRLDGNPGDHLVIMWASTLIDILEEHDD